MKKILFNNASKGLQVDWKGFEALQNQNLQLIEGFLKSLLPFYQEGDIIILYGCNITDANDDGTWDVEAGKVYYNGEVYDVDASSVAFPDGRVWKIISTDESAKFNDGASYVIRQTNKMAVVNGLPGSGIADTATRIQAYGWMDVEDGIYAGNYDTSEAKFRIIGGQLEFKGKVVCLSNSEPSSLPAAHHEIFKLPFNVFGDLSPFKGIRDIYGYLFTGNSDDDLNQSYSLIDLVFKTEAHSVGELGAIYLDNIKISL